MEIHLPEFLEKKIKNSQKEWLSKLEKEKEDYKE